MFAIWFQEWDYSSDYTRSWKLPMYFSEPIVQGVNQTIGASVLYFVNPTLLKMTSEISLFQCKNSPTFHWNFSDISLKFQWHFIEMSVIFTEFQWNISYNFSDISVKFQQYFNGFKWYYQWNFSDISMDLNDTGKKYCVDNGVHEFGHGISEIYYL